MKVRAVVDRFEGERAILLLEDYGSEPVQWLRKALPSCKEGDVLQLAIEVDRTETAAARETAAALLDDLLKENG